MIYEPEALYFDDVEAARKIGREYANEWFGYSGGYSVNFDHLKQKWRLQRWRFNTCD